MTKPAALPINERERLAALRRYAILDTGPDEGLDRIVRLAARQFGVKIALISLVDEERQWFKAACGLDTRQTSRDIAFCAHAILQDGVFVVHDATTDGRFADNPLVRDGLKIRFYAGAPLINPQGLALGTLCLIDDRPRETFSDSDKAVLTELAAIVVDQIEMRYAASEVWGDAKIRKRAENELDQSRRFIEAVLQNIQDGIVACDADGRLSLFNESSRRLHGMDSEPVGPDNWSDRYDLYEADGETPLDVEQIPLFRALNGAVVEGQEIVIAPQGRPPRSLVVHATPMFDAEGQKLGAVASMHDVTNERSAEQALRRNQAELELILNNIPIRVFYKDDKNRILRLNEPAARSMRMNVSEVEGQNTYDLFPTEAAKYHKDDLEVIEAGQPKLGIVERYTPRDGEKGWVRTDKVPYIDPLTGERFIFVAATNITAEKNAEEALRTSERRYRTLYNSTPVMLYSIDPDGNIVSVSDFWLEKMGYRRGQVIGRKSTEFMTPESARKATDKMLPLLQKSGACKDVEYQFVTRSGDVLDILLSAIVEYDDEGKVVRSMAVLIDVTERKVVERQFLQAQKMESVGQLTGGLAHDFNNLLGVVLGNLQLVERSLDADEKTRRRIDAAKNAVEKGAELTRRLLAFSRRQPLEKESLDPNPLIESLIEMLQRVLGEHIALECRLKPDVPRVRTDPSQLESAILNLAVNARDAMPDGGALTIESDCLNIDEQDAKHVGDVDPGEYVMLAVTDTGAGIPAETLPRVFEPFFTTKETGKGTGLGLSMVYGFLNQTGGHVRIYSELGKGTTVRLYLPVDRGGARQDRIDAIDDQKKRTGGSETVLVVEDQDDVRDVASALIEDLGYTVLSAANGHEALAIVKSREDIDLLFTDMVMPGDFDGVQLARSAQALRPGLPVIYTTGYADAAVLREGRITRTSNLVTKPYRRADLAGKIRLALDREVELDDSGASSASGT